MLVRRDGPNILLLGIGGSPEPVLGLELAQLGRNSAVIVDDRHCPIPGVLLDQKGRIRDKIGLSLQSILEIPP